MLLREIIIAYCVYNAEHINTLCGKILDFLKVLHILVVTTVLSG